MKRIIPEGSIEIQKGLWLYQYNKTISGTEYTFRQLYSSEDYCFYSSEVSEEERIYWQFMSLGIDMNDLTYDELNNIFISIHIEEDKKIQIA